MNQLRSRRGGWSWCQAAKLDVIMGGHPFFLLPLMRKALLKRPNRRRVPRADSASEVPSLTSFK